MKAKFISDLRKELLEYEISKEEMNEILEDFSNMIEEGVLKGLTEKESVDKLGNPKRICAEVCEGYSKSHSTNKGEKLIALTPFISAVIFLVLGFNFGLWHPGWLIFLIIPITAILVEVRSEGLTILLTSLSPFIATFIFFILGRYDLWHPGWLVFFIIPIIGILNEKRSLKRDVFLIITILSVLMYLYLGYTYKLWDFGLLIFVAVILLGVYDGYIFIGFHSDELDRRLGFVIIGSIIAFCLLGVVFELWHPGWLVFLTIPVAAIIINKKEMKKGHLLVALSPFFSTMIFVILGYFDLWHPGWLVFMIIPVMGILSD